MLTCCCGHGSTFGLFNSVHLVNHSQFYELKVQPIETAHFNDSYFTLFNKILPLLKSSGAANKFNLLHGKYRHRTWKIFAIPTIR